MLHSCSDNNEVVNEEPTFKSNTSILYVNDYSLGNTSQEQMRKAVLELTDLSKIAFSNADVRNEVSQLIQNDFYKDHIVSLDDLLNPSTSLVYNYADVSENNKGKFKGFFDSYISNNENKTINLVHVKDSRLVGTEQYLETFFDYAHLTFYLPYDDDSNLDPIPMDSNPTLVPAVVEADEARGYEFNGEIYSEVTVDDGYSESRFTIIIQPSYDPCTSLGFPIAAIAAATEDLPVDCDRISSGGSSSNSGTGATTTTPNQYTGNCADVKPAGNYIRQVFVGRAKFRKQYDNFISLTGNGGGSEVRYCRVDSREAIDIDSLGSYKVNQWNLRENQYWSRKQINRENVRAVNILWDNNWECEGEHEQLFVIYEEDNTSDLIIDQDISFDLADDTYAANIDITIQNRSKDQAVILRTREESEFFITNLLDNGSGCWDGDFSFSDRCWGINAGGTDVPYTMHHRWVPIQ